jgi:GT2 family glycosyltransferase
MAYKPNQPVVVIPNLNGGDALLEAIQSLTEQSLLPYIIVVDNASTDGSAEQAAKKYPQIEIIRNTRNRGYAGGVNPGLDRAIKLGAVFAGPFNDDAIADKRWLKQLVDFLESNPKYGGVAPKVVSSDHERLDSTGEFYTSWGLSYPRGRREYDTHKYDHDTNVFAASGAACLYRVRALQEVGLLDEDFFAYYEDVDLSFRLQLAGWKIAFLPGSVVYHHIGMTANRVSGFYAQQTLKNLPLLWFKNVPKRYFWHIGLRLSLVQLLFFGRAITRGHGWAAVKGSIQGCLLLIKKIPARRHIQAHRKLTDKQFESLLVYDLPPNAGALRLLRTRLLKLTRRGVA